MTGFFPLRGIGGALHKNTSNKLIFQPVIGSYMQFKKQKIYYSYESCIAQSVWISNKWVWMTSQRTQLTFSSILERVRSSAAPCTLEAHFICFLLRQIIGHDFIDYLSIFFIILFGFNVWGETAADKIFLLVDWTISYVRFRRSVSRTRCGWCEIENRRYSLFSILDKWKIRYPYGSEKKKEIVWTETGFTVMEILFKYTSFDFYR